MFERYTEAARQAVFVSRDEACRSGARAIETHHLLLGVLQSDSSIAVPILGTATIKQLREELSAGARDPMSESSEIPFSPESKRALSFSSEEAERCGSTVIKPAHLLAALLHEDTRAAGSLKKRGFDLTRCRSEFTSPTCEMSERGGVVRRRVPLRRRG
jgi:ATP-dependent Clp protease ATP-binding subunit ClpC